MNMQVIAPDRPVDQCQFWDCSMALTPFCSQFHENLAEEGELSQAAVVVVDGTTEAHAKFVSLKCLRGKILNHHARYGLPMLPMDVLLSPPWLQPAVFDMNLFAVEAAREWVFFGPMVTGTRLGTYWQHYESRISDHRRSRWYLSKKSPAKHTGYFRLTLFCVDETPLAVYWLLYKPAVPGERGHAIESPVPLPKKRKDPMEEDTPSTDSQLQTSGDQSSALNSQAIPGSTASNPLQVQDYEERRKVFYSESFARPYVTPKAKFITFASADAETDNSCGGHGNGSYNATVDLSPASSAEEE